MSSNQLKLGSLISYAQIFLNIIIGMVYTPVMIRLLGQSEYGLYNTVASTITMLGVLSLGLNSTYIRHYSAYKVRNDQDGINRLNGLFTLILLFIGTIALLCGLYLSFNLRLVFSNGLTAQEYKTAKILMILLSINLGLSFPMSVFSSIVAAHERYVLLKLLNMLKTVFSPLIALPLLLLGFGSISLVTATLCISIATDLIYFFFVRYKLHCRFVFHGFEPGLFKKLVVYTSFIALNSIVSQINDNIPKFLLGRFQGTGDVAVYSVGCSLYMYYMTFSTSISGVFTPRVHRLVQSTASDPTEQSRQLTELFTKVGRIQFSVLALIASGLVFFGKPFIAFWAGEGYEQAYYVALLLILPITIDLIQNIGIEIQRALNRHQFRSIVYICMAVLNLVTTYFLCQRLGVIGAVIGTSASFILANGVFMNFHFQKYCGIRIGYFWKRIGRLAVGMIPAVVVGILLNRFWDMSSFVRMAVGIGLYALVYMLGMWFLGFSDYEKNLIRKPLRKLLRRS